MKSFRRFDEETFRDLKVIDFLGTDTYIRTLTEFIQLLPFLYTVKNKPTTLPVCK